MAVNNLIDQYYGAGTALQDAIKTLRTNIQFSSVDREVKTIVITSVLPHEGKSTLITCLGITMAEYGQRALLVECDCRRPMLQNYLRMQPETNMVDVLSKKAKLEAAIQKTSLPGLDLLSSSVLANPVEVLGSQYFWSLIEGLKDQYDAILLDTPPLGSFIEPAILASKADGTVLVLQPGSTDVSAAQAVVAQLEKAKARILGVVLNNVEMNSESYYYSDYYYRDKGRKGKRGRAKPLLGQKKVAKT